MTAFEKFKKACLKWQHKLGLLDWRLTFAAIKREPEYGACVQVGIENRHVIVSFNVTGDHSMSAEHLAKHEMLHVLLADFGATAAIRGNRSHPDAEIEEHRVVERLLKVLS